MKGVDKYIKPLEWVEWCDGFQAHTPFGSYTVEPRNEFNTSALWRYCFDEYYDEDESYCDSVEEGKALAQENWIERVRSIVRDADDQT